MVETDLEVSPPSPAPTSDSYVGCFNDMIADRVMASVTVDDALTPEVRTVGLQQRRDTVHWVWSTDATRPCYVGPLLHN